MGGKLSSVWPSAVGIIVLTSFLGAYGAQKGPPYSGFLEAYPEMEPLKGVAGAFFYRQPEVDFSTYKKVMVDPVEVQLKPPEKEPAGGSEKDATAITGEELARLTDYFREAILMEFEGAGFSVAQDPETDTLRIRVAITDLVPGDPAVYLAFSAPYAGFVSLANRIATGAHLGVGQAAVETEIVDAATGIRLVVFIDRKAGSKFNVPGGMKKWGHVEAAMRQWARIFRKRLIERGGENAAGVVSDTSERSADAVPAGAPD